MYGASDSLLLGAHIHFFTVVDIKVAKVAKMAKLPGLGGQVGHVDEVVDFSGFG